MGWKETIGETSEVINIAIENVPTATDRRDVLKAWRLNTILSPIGKGSLLVELFKKTPLSRGVGRFISFLNKHL